MLKTNKKTFTKIRKWAEVNGYEVVDNNYFEKIKVVVNEELSFEIVNRESTIYTSIRGKKGNPKGIYLSKVTGNRTGYSFHYTTQADIIESMSNEIDAFNKSNAEVELENEAVEPVAIKVEVASDSKLGTEAMPLQVATEIVQGYELKTLAEVKEFVQIYKAVTKCSTIDEMIETTTATREKIIKELAEGLYDHIPQLKQAYEEGVVKSAKQLEKYQHCKRMLQSSQ